MAVTTGCSIHLFDSFTFELITVLSSHLEPIIHIGFNRTDNEIFSIGKDGAIYNWNLNVTLVTKIDHEKSRFEKSCK